MGNQLLASKVVTQEAAPSAATVPGVATAVCGMLGVTERGPVDQAVLCTSFQQFVTVFGGFVANSDATASVQGFFTNGGTELWFVRVVHHSDVTDPTTKTSAHGSLTLMDRAGTPLATLRVDGKYDGTYANGLKIKIAAATSGDTDAFNLQVLDATTSIVKEDFPNLSMTSTSKRYAPTVINAALANGGSALITVTDLTSATASPGNLPATGTLGPLTSGADGLGSLADTDFTGGAGSNGKVGLRSLDEVSDLTMLVVPGHSATAAVSAAMIAYGDVTREGRVFCIFDPPAGESASQAVTYTKSTAALKGATENGMIAWPRIKIGNPSTTAYGTATDVVIPASGHIAGMICRNDNATAGGVYTPPAGRRNGVLLGLTGLERPVYSGDDQCDLVYPSLICPIAMPRGGGAYFLDGSRVLKDSGNFPYIHQRRGVTFIESSIEDALDSFRHLKNTPQLRNEIRRTCERFLTAQMQLGAFATTDPKTAFFVDVSDEIQYQTNLVNARVGLNVPDAVDWIVLTYSKVFGA